MPMPGPTTADLIFSEQANHNFSKTLGDLKRSTLSVHNRLTSIQEDAVFVQTVAAAYNRPLIANERCGSWYIDPQKKAGSAYFKSTDGHTGVWKFSSRRLNLHLLEIIGKSDGCIIVDSTRRGKRMPDALSKTIPIWCAVLNCLLFPGTLHQLYTPPQVVSESEHAQIDALLPIFLESLRALDISTKDLQSRITKPLRPMWITPESQLETTNEVFEHFHPVICCTVSRRVPGGELSEGGYIQGAGDDTENWAHGLTPPVYWHNLQILDSTSEVLLPELIQSLIKSAPEPQVGESTLICVKPTSLIYITTLAGVFHKDTASTYSAILLLPKVTDALEWRLTKSRLEVGLGPHKIGSRNLRSVLATIVDFVEDSWNPLRTEKDESRRQIMIACETGKDFSVGVALVLLCVLFDDGGKVRPLEAPKPVIDKTYIRKRLGWISASMPHANPSRATLQSVNRFLMERP